MKKSALLAAVKDVVKGENNNKDYSKVMTDTKVSVPFIALYNDDVEAIFTYNLDETNLEAAHASGWKNN